MRRYQHGVRAVALPALVLLATCLFSGTAAAKPMAAGAFLGVYTRSMDVPMLEALNYDGEGVLIEDVVADAPADKAGLRAGDILVKVNDRTIFSPKSLRRALWRLDAGDKATLTYWRNGKDKTAKVTLAERPERGTTKKMIVRGGDDDEDFDFDFNVQKFLTKSKRGYLGVQLGSLNDQLRDYFGVKKGEGSLVREVVEDGPAEKAGLKAGDVIVKIGDEEVDGRDDIVDFLRDHKKGDKIPVTVVRDRKETTIEVTLGETDSYDFSGIDIDPQKVQIMARDAMRKLPEIHLEMKELRDDLRELRGGRGQAQ